MKKSEIRVAIREMDTYQFGLKNELHNKLSKVTSYVSKKEVIDLIDQIEEPEQGKVVIPQFVANHIEGSKQMGKRLNVALSESPETEMILQMDITIFEANNIYARAWIDGYAVEKEKLYYVIFVESEDKEKGQALYKDFNFNGDKVVSTHIESFNKTTALEADNFCFTEQEIKSIDERFWAFAEEITK